MENGNAGRSLLSTAQHASTEKGVDRRDSQDTPDRRVGNGLHEIHTLVVEAFVILEHLLYRSVLLPWSSLTIDLLVFWTVKASCISEN